MKKLSLILLISFIFLGFSNSYAQGDRHAKHRNSALKKEVKAYIKKNVLPVLRVQRVKLEKDISAEDNTQLKTYRLALKENNQLIKEGRKKRKEAKKSDKELSQTEKEAIWIAEGKQKEIMHKTRDLGKSYKEKIKTLFDEIATKEGVWENELKAIHEKHKLENKGDDDDKGGKQYKKRMGHKGGIKRLTRPSHFLLFDPNASDDDLEEVFDDNQ